jgi:hypothetical protein
VALVTRTVNLLLWASVARSGMPSTATISKQLFKG